MIEVYRKIIKQPYLKRLRNIEKGTWVNVVNPSEKEIKNIIYNTNIERQFIYDALDPYEVPRIEKENDITYIIVRVPQKIKKELVALPFLIVLTPEHIITISREKLEILSDFLSENIEFYTSQKAKMLIQLFLKISQSYEKYVKNIARSVQGKKINLKKLDDKDILNLVEWEEILNNFISSLVSNISVSEKILQGKFIPLYKEDEELIEDLVITSRQTLELSKTTIKNISNAREAYTTILSNSLNKIIKFLTSITIIITIPTIIASIYGMNIHLPLENNPYAFTYVNTLTLILMVILIWVFYKKKWL